jgi:alkanesulfonate monooxygenase SsuD/methylene tetrahydromethanopterin reductase-like flavin-dependent oxidoreductase (luciferase family)
MLEYIPGRTGRGEALSMISAIPDELVRQYVLHGSPDDVQRQLEPYAAAGMEHVVILNVAPLADPASARQSFALMDDMATGLQFQLQHNS